MTEDLFQVILIGAGEINFGSPGGPWNHTARLEAELKASLKILAIIDPDVKRSQSRVAEKLRNTDANVRAAYEQTSCYKSIQDASVFLGNAKVDLTILGCPPHFRGTCIEGKNMDIQLLTAFPQTRGILVEKPVSANDPLQTDCRCVADAYERWGGIVCVGYMLRYLNVVAKVKSILQENCLIPTCINARYIMAYEYAQKLSWWNKEESCGPIVEQATHFVDLIRYIADTPVESNTINTTTVEHHEPSGNLSKLRFSEDAIPAENRIPRLTVSTWKHQKGTIGSLLHGVSLHGTTYSTEIDIIADGWLLRLSAVYTNKPTLHIIGPGSTNTEVISLLDDPFLTQFQSLICRIQTGPNGVCKSESEPLSSYKDALETYDLTWRIRKAGETLPRSIHLCPSQDVRS